MNWRVLVLTVFLPLLVAAPAAHAENLYLQVFYDTAPLKGVEARIGEEAVGSTDSLGSLAVSVSVGPSTVFLVDKDGLGFPVQIDVGEGNDVEVGVTFTSIAGDPEVTVAQFPAGDVTLGSGVITGTVRDSSGTPVPYASLQAGAISGRSDSEGIFQLMVPRGGYDLVVEAEDMARTVVPDLRVLDGYGISVAVSLYPDGSNEPSLALEEVVVVGVFQAQESAADLQRYATSIVNAIDVEMLERFGDSDVASALQRVSGISVQEEKYATVRGLDGRYLSSNLNGLLMPSTDPQRRDVQLDLIPTNVLGGIEITKAFTPEQMASTTGGSIKIKSKGLPEAFAIEASGGIGYITDVTGEDVLYHQGSNTDAFGFDDGRRDLLDWVLDTTDGGTRLRVCDPGIPLDSCVDPIIAAGVGVAMEDDYNVKSKKGIPPAKLGLSIGDRRSAGDSGEWGYYLAGNYSYALADRGEAALTDPIGRQGLYQRTAETIDISGYGVLGYEWGVANELLSKTTLLRSTDIVTRQDDYFDTNEDIERNRTILQFVERQFASQSFHGHHEFDFGFAADHKLDWSVGYSQTQRDEPDRRQYEYYNGFLSFSAFERRWSELEEDSFDLTIDYTLPIEWSGSVYTDVIVGALLSDKEREVELYRFSVGRGSRLNDLPTDITRDLEAEVLSYGNFALDAFRIRPTTAPTDSYDSEENVLAYYLTLNTEVGDSLSFLVGARYEEFEQTIDYPNSISDSSALEVDDVYPAANLTWRPTDNWQARLAVSRTVSYPGLIERTESTSFDPITDDPIFGNPNLVASEIDNFDARLEYFFSDTERVTLSYFYKDISNPIERALPDASGSAAQGITFRNQKSAELSGLELEVALDLVDSLDWLVFAAGNVSYIDSEVELGPDSLRLEGANADGRALQGQSEYLANIQLGVDHYPSEQKLTLLVNYFDDRIFRIARGAATGPWIEMGRTMVDLQYEKRFSDSFSLGFSVKNLLNDEVQYSQNSRAIETYENGISFALTLNYEFL